MPVYHVFLRRFSSPPAKGFTLVELLLAIAVMAILAAMAASTFQDIIAKARVRAAAEAVQGLLQQARNETVIRDTKLSVTINSDHWCVGVSDVVGCDCTLTAGEGACVLNVAGEDALYQILGSEFANVALSDNFPGDGTRFSPVRRNASPGGTIILSSQGHSLEIKVGLSGRIRICQAADSTIIGYPDCD